ncbi:As/Sb_Reductase [Leishmania major strain Friedlin]|nr:Sb(V)-As(V) reductase [Leishmania major]CAG9580412.1 As/Sb_Reductase [Leishmania major strain Friedlin]
MTNYTYIKPEELVELLDNPDSLVKAAVIDCRDSDRDCGFIVNSINMPTISCTEEMYEKLAKTLFEEKKELAVFHCAQSLVRAPKGANRFALAQKKLGYVLPAVYVLRGGWEAFYHMYGDVRPDLMYV